MARFRVARAKPAAYVSNECMHAIPIWAGEVWKHHQQTREEPLPIFVTIAYYDRSEQHAWQSENLKRVVLGRPTGEPKRSDGRVGDGGPVARPRVADDPSWRRCCSLP